MNGALSTIVAPSLIYQAAAATLFRGGGRAASFLLAAGAAGAACALVSAGRRLAQTRRQMQALAAVASVPLSNDIDQILQTVATVVAPLCELTALTLWQPTADDGLLRLHASSTAAPAATTCAPGGSLADGAFATRAPVWQASPNGAQRLWTPLGADLSCCLICCELSSAPVDDRERRFYEALAALAGARVGQAQKAAELAEARAAGARSARERAEQTAMTLHELRTPLYSLLGFADVLLAGDAGALAARQQRYLGHIVDGGRHLLLLVDDLLDASKLEAGRLVLRCEPCAPGPIIDDVLAGLARQASVKQVMLVAPPPGKVPCVVADPLRLKQALLNLVANAIRFTPAQRRVGVELVGAERCLRIVVWDEGDGIAEDDLRRLFQPFVQLPNARLQAEPGSGLGLALTKRVVEHMGGRIVVDGGLGRGARFTIELPTATSEPATVSGEPRLPRPHDEVGVAPLASTLRSLPSQPANDAAAPGETRIAKAG